LLHDTWMFLSVTCIFSVVVVCGVSCMPHCMPQEKTYRRGRCSNAQYQWGGENFLPCDVCSKDAMPSGAKTCHGLLGNKIMKYACRLQVCGIVYASNSR